MGFIKISHFNNRLIVIFLHCFCSFAFQWIFSVRSRKNPSSTSEASDVSAEKTKINKGNIASNVLVKGEGKL